MEGSGYNVEFAYDYLMFTDEVAEFNTTPSEQRQQRYTGVMGCTLSERGMFSDQEADGIFGLGLATNRRSL